MPSLVPTSILYRRMVTSADMKAADVDKATPRTLTPDQRVATWS